MKRRWPVVIVAAFAVVAAGCVPATITGGGSGISALQGGAKVNMGISSTCTSQDPTIRRCLEASLSGTYHDKGVNQDFPTGVTIAFAGVAHYCITTDPVCVAAALAGGSTDDTSSSWMAVAAYRSQDKKHPGNGCAIVDAFDSNRNGKPDKGDTVHIEILDQTALDRWNDEIGPTDCTVAGPFAGYVNDTSVAGNLTITTLAPPATTAA
jgi:hypothetical protein